MDLAEIPVSSLKDSHRGGTVLIVGNGPSAAEADLSRATCTAFGINKAYKLLRCDYNFAVDFVTIRDDKEFCAQPNIIAPSRRQEFLVGRAHSWIPYRGYGKRPPIGFSMDCAEGVFTPTTPHVAMQFAVYMGFKRILLIGFDMGGRGPDSVDYFYDKDKTWKGEQSTAYQYSLFGLAAGICRSIGVEIVDLSQYSKLRILRRKRFDVEFP
jgi:hypothetical protein